MQCKNHPTDNGVNTCNQCGSWICDTCSFERGGRIFCPNCATQQASVGSASYAPPSAESRSYAPPSGYEPTVGHVSRSISWGLLFLFSVVIPLPGLNYMYMGFIKRGLVAMAAFFGSIYMLIQLGGSVAILIAFVLPVLWLACTFDGFRMRARIHAGEVITDNIDDITSFVQRNKTALIGFLLILVAINIAGGILPWLVRLLRNMLPVLIAIWAIFTLFKKK